MRTKKQTMDKVELNKTRIQLGIPIVVEDEPKFIDVTKILKVADELTPLGILISIIFTFIGVMSLKDFTALIFMGIVLYHIVKYSEKILNRVYNIIRRFFNKKTL